MSYDIHLNAPVTKQILELDGSHFMRGGTYFVIEVLVTVGMILTATLSTKMADSDIYTSRM